MKKTAYVLRFFLAAVLLACALGLGVSAERVLSHAIPGYNGNESLEFAPSMYSSSVKNLSIYSNNWTFSGDVAEQGRRLKNSVIYAYAKLYTEEDLLSADQNQPKDDALVFAGSTAITLSYEGHDIGAEDFTTLRFGLSPDCFSPSGKFTGHSLSDSYPVSVTILLESGEAFTSSLLIESGSWSLVSLDIRPLQGKGNIASITVEISYEDAFVPSYFYVSTPYMQKSLPYALSTADRYSTSHLTASVGTFSAASGKVRIDNGGAELSGSLMTTADLSPDTPVVVYLRLSGILSGNLRFSVTGENGSVSTGKITLSNSMSDTQLLAIPLTFPENPQRFTLLFDSVVCDRSFTIESLSIPDNTVTPCPGHSEVGSLTSLKREGNTLSFEGTMERAALREYSGSYIQFYAVPPTSADTLEGAQLLGSVKVSTVFTYTVDISSLSDLADTYLFFAAIPETDAQGTTHYTLLSRPRYPDASVYETADLSPIGLTGCASVGVFESNASHVLLDIPLNELLTTDGNTVLTYTDSEKEDGSGLRRVHLSHDLLSSLDKEVTFYLSSGTQVYLRLYAEEAIEGFTYGGDGETYMPDLTQSGVRSLWAALIRYLSQRYSGITGFTLGLSANAPVYTGSDAFGDGSDEALASYMASFAELCRVTYNAASPSVPGVRIVVPVYTHLNTQNGIPLSPFTTLLTHRISLTGSIPLVFQPILTGTGTEQDEGTVSDSLFAAEFEQLNATRRLMGELGLTAPAQYVYLWQVDSEALLAEYEAAVSAGAEDGNASFSQYAATRLGDIADTCVLNRGYAVFASLSDTALKNDHAFYAALKAMGDGENRYVYDTSAIQAPLDLPAVHTLFDFSRAFYQEGWISGGESLCTTEKSTRFSDETDTYARVLRTVFSQTTDGQRQTEEAELGVAGIVIRNLSRTYDMTELDGLEFTFSLESTGEGAATSEESTATVVLLIGSADHRAEYYAPNIPAGQIVTLSCDLTDFAYRHTVDYIGVMLYAETDLMLDLSTVRMGSDSLSAEELTAMFAPIAEEERPVEWGTVLLVVLFIVAGSAIMVVILTRRDHEERQAALAKEAKNRRKHYERQ